eukprot:6101233-Amphidinium_carterae.1
MAYNSKQNVDKLWEMSKEIKGKDPDLYRRSADGSTMYKHNYGKDSKMGYQVDHIKARSSGGSDNIRNLQLLNSHYNMSKGSSSQKASRHSKSNK